MCPLFRLRQCGGRAGEASLFYIFFPIVFEDFVGILLWLYVLVLEVVYFYVFFWVIYSVFFHICSDGCQWVMPPSAIILTAHSIWMSGSFLSANPSVNW